MGFSYACCVHDWLINKENWLGLIGQKHRGRPGELNGMLGGKRRSQREVMKLLPETDTRNFTWLATAMPQYTD